MVKFYESFFNYDYPFPAVSLAYFLRYPNPYATHVLSTDVIDRTFDPSTQRLHTTRLHLKRSKIPPTVLKLLPKGILGASSDGGQSYILEKSVVDVREGWMKTETRNLEWTGILSIIEKQYYRRPSDGMATPGSSTRDLVEKTKKEGTDVTTTVTLLSRFGQAKLLKKRGETTAIHPISSTSSEEEEAPVRKGIFSSWSTSSLQRTIEAVGLRRTREALAKSKDGMTVVLERLRHGGLVQVLEGMQEDSHRTFGQDPNLPWKRAWRQGKDSGSEDSS
ncbi:hypothetical protein N7G274_002276 [Stereocaulon virgatum]|uniref:PRELI/MSF1 domain-containing protein n=1 Tax=Stereocaulon virgatum TaxID=373712 RepID=A0ABR4AHF5_9LECA